MEIARLAEAFSYHQGAEIMESLDDETAAETLEEMAAERQAQIIGDMDQSEQQTFSNRCRLMRRRCAWRSARRKGGRVARADGMIKSKLT